MSRLQRVPRLRSLRLATTDHLHHHRCLNLLQPHSFILSTTASKQNGPARRAMAELSPSRSAPSIATPPAQRRVSDRMWSPEQGIVFAKPSSSVSNGSLTRAVSDGRVATHTASLQRRVRSNSSLESLGREYRATPGQQSDFLPPIHRIRSNDELRVHKQRRRVGVQAERPFSTSLPRPSPQRQPQKSHNRPEADGAPWEPVRSVLENVTLFLHHWMGVLLGLPALSLSFAGSEKFTSIWSNIFGPTSEPPNQPNSIYWTYKSDAQKTGVMPKVRLCTDKATSDKVAAEFLNEKILGFDLEWEASAPSSAGPKRNVSLIQVAKKDLIALFQIARFPGENNADLMPSNLKRLIEDTSILKTGVNIAGDCTRLRNHFKVDPKGIFELSHAYRLVKYHDGPIESLRQINKKLVSLATQAEEHLGLPLFKEADVRASDWTRVLSAQQTLYAASDAYACYRLFYILDEKRAAIDPPPPRPAAYERGQPIRLANGQTVAEYLADHRVDAAIVQEVIRTDSECDSESAEELDLSSNSSEASSSDAFSESEPSTDTKSGSLSSNEQQLVYAASVFAEEQRAKLEASSSPRRTKPLQRQLQAYFLWHAKALDVADAARLLLIKPSSVACYALEAIAVAKLPYDPARAQKELLPKVPPRVFKARFWMFESLRGKTLDQQGE